MKKIVFMLDDIFLALSMASFVAASYLLGPVQGTYALSAVLLAAAVIAALRIGNVSLPEIMKGQKRRDKKP